MVQANPKARVCLEDFDFLETVGQGSFGKVCVAVVEQQVMTVRKKDSGKIYAMKVLKKVTEIVVDVVRTM